MYWDWIETQAPVLRRTGLALTGSQAGADHCVVLALELLRAEPDRLVSEKPGTAAFKALIDAWNTLNDRIAPQFRPDGIVLALQRLGRKDREILSLHGVAQLGFDACARVLGRPSAQIRRQFFDAMTRLRLVNGSRALLLEGELTANRRLDELLRQSDLGHTSIRIRSDDVESAVERELPSVIVADPAAEEQLNVFDTLQGIRRWWQAPSIMLVGCIDDFPADNAARGVTIVGKPYCRDELLGAIRVSLGQSC